MAKRAGLNALKVKSLTRVGLHADGGGLYLQVSAGGTRSWIFRYQLAGRRRLMGLGPADVIGLAQARERALAARRLVVDGKDPIDARRIGRGAARLAAAKTISFRQAAEAYIEAHRAGWGAKHAAQWHSSLASDVDPILGELPVAAIDAGLVLKVLEPAWTTKPNTASRLRGRIEAVLDWAAVRGHRPAGDNPARWKGHLEHSLPAPAKVARVEHHAAMPYVELPGFMAELKQLDGMASKALCFVILTAARSGEVLGARWNEIDLAERVWTVPGDRIKGGREHKVPISDAAIALLCKPGKPDAFCFPGARPGRPLAHDSLRSVMRDRLGRDGVTVHGFRSAFADWATERTNYPSDAIELALAHRVGDAVVAAYRRSDLFDRRRRLMADWAKFCDSPPVTSGETKVVKLRS